MENLETIYKFRWQIALVLFGVIFCSTGFILMSNSSSKNHGVEIIQEDENGQEVVVEVSGAVDNPGVKILKDGDRIEDALSAAGGLTESADVDWVESTINRAAKITDGQKIYIPSASEQSDVLSANDETGYQSTSQQNYGQTEEKVNINTASQKELEELWGIGPVYAQNIIEHRPYSSIEELLTKEVIKQNVYDKNKDLLTVY